jgi:hypothetical protein
VARRIGPPVAEVHTPLVDRPVSRGEPFRTDPPLEEVILAGPVGANLPGPGR